MNTRERRSQRDYTLTFKLSVVDRVEKGELSYKEAQERYGIQGKTTVLTQAARVGFALESRWHVWSTGLSAWLGSAVDAARGLPVRRLPRLGRTLITELEE